jgi:PleD family two-component response regulator
MDDESANQIQLKILQRSFLSSAIIVCLLDESASALESTSRILSSAGYQIRPFRQPNSFLEWVRIHSPQFAIVTFGGADATGLAIAARAREISPTTSVIVSLKVHRSQAQGLLPGSELVNLIERKHREKTLQGVTNGPQTRETEGIELGRYQY